MVIFLATRLDNNKYDASDHKSLTADVRLSKEDPVVLQEKFRKKILVKSSNQKLLFVVFIAFSLLFVFWNFKQ